MKSYRGEIERSISHLRRFARALVVDHRADVADEIVHDALTQALRMERNWAGEDVSVRLYGRIVAGNRARMRTHMGERRVAPGSAMQADRHHEPELWADRHQGAGASQGALDQLSLSDREALLLVVLGGFDYPKAAQILGIPTATLITRLTHARDHLGSSLWESAEVAQDRPWNRHPGPRRPTHLRLVKS